MIAIALCAIGGLVRDGMPPLGSTHAARGLGGFLCVLGGFLTTWDWTGALLGFAVYLGFYTDCWHGEGMQARDWEDAGYLAVSGLTSLLPLAVASWWLDGAWWVALVALAKPAIWFTAWRLPVKWSHDPEGFLVPTRIAAVTWGALVGGILAVV